MKQPLKTLALALAAATLLNALAAAPAAAQEVTLAAQLPTARERTALAWSGTHAYVFAGHAGRGVFLDEVVKFTPSVRAVSQAPNDFVNGRHTASAFWIAPHAYLAGGYYRNAEDVETESPAIWRFDPATGDVALAGGLPSPRAAMSSVSIGSRAFLIGGVTATGVTDEILVSSGGSAELFARLPSARAYTTAVAVGTDIYVYGGIIPGPTLMDEIVRINTVSGDVTRLTLRLPRALGAASSAFDARDRPADGCPGGCTYIFGGDGAVTNNILRHNRALNRIDVVGSLAASTQYGNAFWAGDAAYVLGGSTMDRSIFRFDPANQAPVASFTASVDELEVSVDASASLDRDGTIASYRWIWGDGTPDGSGRTAIHEYAAAGPHEVRLIVRDNDGAAHETTRTVATIAPPSPAPEPSLEPEPAPQPEPAPDTMPEADPDVDLQPERQPGPDAADDSPEPAPSPRAEPSSEPEASPSGSPAPTAVAQVQDIKAVEGNEPPKDPVPQEAQQQTPASRSISPDPMIAMALIGAMLLVALVGGVAVVAVLRSRRKE